MPELDPVRQEILVQATQALATFDDLIAKAEEFASAMAGATDAIAQWAIAADDAATIAEALASRMNDAADAAARVAAPAEAAAAAMADMSTEGAVSAAALTGLTGRLDDLAMMSAAAVSELHDLRTAMLGVAAASVLSAAATGTAGAATAAADTAAAASVPVLARVGGWWGVLGGRVTLFGGALNGVLPAMLTTVSVWHILADAVLEFGTTLLEAAAGVAAFGAFAAPTFQHIYVQLQNIWTASNALNTAIYPLSASFSSLGQAVRPEAYQLFGEALVAVNTHMGEFQQVAADAGKVLDQLGGRFVAAISNTSTLNNFLSDSTRSLSEWGNIVGNVGGILGNFLHALPGYANLLTHALEGVTGALEAITASGFVQWLLEAGLAIHGALLWSGLAVTALFALRGPLVAMAGWVTGAVESLVGLGVAFTAVAAEEGVFAATTALLSRISPFGWAVIAVGVLVGLAVAIASTRDAAQQFNSTMQQMVTNSPINQLSENLALAVQQTSAQVVTSNQQVAASQDQVSKSLGDTKFGLLAEDAALHSVRTTASDYQQGLSQLDSQQQTLNAHVGDLTKQYGSAANAWGLVTEAGITSSQMLTTNAQAWKGVEVQIQAVADANSAMALGAGRNAAAMNALNYAGDTTNNVLGSLDADMTKVVSGMDSITNVVLGGEQALTGFFQALNQTKTDAKAAGTSLTGLNTQSLQYASDVWSSLLPGMQKTTDAMQMQLATTPQLTAATATMAQQILAAAGPNTAVETAVISLINNALGPGTVSFQNYDQWIAQNATTLQGLEGIIGQTTTQASILANTIGSQMNASFASNLLTVTGAQQALSTYTQDLVSNNQNTAAGQGDRAKLITDLEQAGLTAQQATTYVQGLATQLGKIVSPPPVTIKITTEWVTVGTPPAGSTAAVNPTAYALGHNVAPPGSASGGYVQGPGTGISDSIAARLSHGEYVMNAAAVQHYGVAAMSALNARKLAGGGSASITPGLMPALLEARGGNTSVNLHTSNILSLSGRKILSQQRTEQLNYSRRNPGSDWSLRARLGTPR